MQAFIKVEEYATFPLDWSIDMQSICSKNWECFNDHSQALKHAIVHKLCNNKNNNNNDDDDTTKRYFENGKSFIGQTNWKASRTSEQLTGNSRTAGDPVNPTSCIIVGAWSN